MLGFCGCRQHIFQYWIMGGQKTGVGSVHNLGGLKGSTQDQHKGGGDVTVRLNCLWSVSPISNYREWCSITVVFLGKVYSRMQGTRFQMFVETYMQCIFCCSGGTHSLYVCHHC